MKPRQCAHCKEWLSEDAFDDKTEDVCIDCKKRFDSLALVFRAFGRRLQENEELKRFKTKWKEKP